MAPLRLSQEQVEHYCTQGYLILRSEEHGLIDPSDLRAWADEVKGWPKVRGKWMPYEEVNTSGEKQLMRTENFVEYQPGFKQLLLGEDLRGILAQVSGKEMLLFKDKINYKAAKGNGFQAHLDAPAYDHIGKIEHVTANFAIDAATVENGCLEVVPGSHRMNVELEHGGKITDAWCAGQNWVKVPLQPGDVLVFGSHLAHRSAPNLTDKPRGSLYATFHARSDGEDLRQKYYAHRRMNFPPDHERDPEKDYSAGWKTYAFAAPFSQHNIDAQQPQTAKVA